MGGSYFRLFGKHSLRSYWLIGSLARDDTSVQKGTQTQDRTHNLITQATFLFQQKAVKPLTSSIIIAIVTCTVASNNTSVYMILHSGLASHIHMYVRRPHIHFRAYLSKFLKLINGLYILANAPAGIRTSITYLRIHRLRYERNHPRSSRPGS